MADDHDHMHDHREDLGRRGGPSLRSGYGDSRHPESVGQLLSRTREQYGQDLRQIAESLRIRYAYLDAIERGQFDALPGPTYAVGFVRSYASFLGLDDNEIVRRFKQEVEGLDRAQKLHFPEPVNEGKVPGGAILLIAVLLVAAAYGGWHYLNGQGRSVADMVPDVPERLQALVGDSESPSVSGPEPEEETEIATESGARQVDGETPAPEAPALDGTASPETAETMEDTPDGVGGADDAEVARSPEDGDLQAALPEAPTVEAPTADAPMAEARDVPAGSDPDDAVPEGTVSEGTVSEGTVSEGTVSEGTVSDDVGEGGEAAREQPADEDTGGSDTAGRDDTQADQVIPAAPGSTGSTNHVGNGQGRVFGETNAESRIILHATGDTWVQVRGGDDSLLLTRVLNPGDIYRVPDRDDLMLHTGNAGGLEIIVDGERMASLGGDGEVRRNIRLDPEVLRDRPM